MRQVAVSHSGNRCPSAAMACAILALLYAAAMFTAPRLACALAQARHPLDAVLTAGAGLSAMLASLIAGQCLVTALFSLSRGSAPLPADASYRPAVAILYPTCNDFQAPAAQTCLSQDYHASHLFLLDDSTDPAFQWAVDRFAALHAGRCTLIRRADRSGFKAGNLNYALKTAAAEYEVFAVVDADERLPQDFLSCTVGYLRNPGIAFVQAGHAPNPGHATLLRRIMGGALLAQWQVFCATHSRFGYAPYLGHGAVMRRDAWERAGGFPETAQEDLAFSFVLAAKGMRGVYREDVVCGEDLPPTFWSAVRQHERYVAGSAKVLVQHLPALAVSPAISLPEKISLGLWSLPLFAPALCLLLMAAGFTASRFPGSALHSLLASGGMHAVLFASALAPAAIYLVPRMRKSCNPLTQIIGSAFLCLSFMVPAWRSLLGYALNGMVAAPPTHARKKATPPQQCHAVAG